MSAGTPLAFCPTPPSTEAIIFAAAAPTVPLALLKALVGGLLARAGDRV
jgi:hypothetical protein